MSAVNAIEIAGLVKRYGEVAAVDGLDLEVERGETFALLGPNGAGKTTTVESCEGYLRPDAGTVRVLGLDPIKHGRALKSRIGLMLQEGGVYPTARPRELLKVYAAFYAKPHDPEELLDRVGLVGAAERRFRDLSGGQKQRLKLALALVGQPELVFLDEPTAGLDPAARRATWKTIRELRHDGVTVLMTTHFLDEAEQLADRVAIIDQGRVLAAGTPAELTHAEDRGAIFFTARGGLDLVALSRACGVPVVEERHGHYRVEAPNSPLLVRRLAAWLDDEGVPLGELRAGKSTLEDVFLRLTEEPVPVDVDGPQQ